MQMNYYSLAKEHRNTGWYLHPLTGNLHQVSSAGLSQFQSNALPKKSSRCSVLTSKGGSVDGLDLNDESCLLNQDCR